MLRKNKWLLSLMAAVLLTLTWSGGTMPQAMAASQGSKIDAVLVMDASNSMKNSDPERISSEAMKMFIDMLATTGDKVGVVSYTDRIQREKALLEIQSEADKTDLKEFIDQLDRGPYTDISVGLDEAVKVLKQGMNPAHAPMIVVLADGNNDLDPNTGKTSQEASDQLDQAVKEAKGSGIPIYTIGLNADGKLNKETLAELANQTGGKSFTTSSADDLPQILSEIFASHQQLKIVPVQSITGNGSYQEVTVNVPNANVLEANISIMSSSPVDVKLVDPAGAEQTIPSANVLRSTSNSYSLLKLLKPQQGDWKLQVKGVSKDKIDINLVFSYDLELIMDPPPPSKVKAGDTIDIKAHLVSNGQKLQDQEQYGNMMAKLLVKDLDTGDESEVELENKGGSFEGDYKIPQKHDYELRVRAEEQSFYRESAPVKISAKAAAAGSGSGGKEMTAGEDAKPFPLWPVIIGIAALLMVGAAAYFILGAIKKANKGFVGQIVIEIRDENTGEKTFPQYKKLTSFKGKFNLHQLLQLAPELKETEKILFMPGKNDRIILKNNSSAVIEKSGRALDASNGTELKNGDRLRVSLQQADKTILFEYLA
ncbi:VWA domain-containing protein [Paenibacillus sp. p3-SID867]|uniref:vWA domain-containing protein n=1 Tax=Paenibacillus sp. p3-SID867 TaxID=2916363 RepID=UPI0021A7887B|nr:vWA domain-containing protein [Paenibacillus sp. p3-SID867]MCT1401882.1 VWA domain-containing protein [Paenibacillus sp. p3-SID867]